MSLREPFIEPMNQNRRYKFKPMVLFGLFVSLAVLILLIISLQRLRPQDSGPQIPLPVDPNAKVAFEQFESDQEFKQYIAQNQQSYSTSFGAMRNSVTTFDTMAQPLPMATGSLNMEQDSAAPSRVSTTNVQVQGIDEPDIVKTNGQELFVSLPSFQWYSEEVTPLSSERRFIAPDEGFSAEMVAPVDDLIAPIEPPSPKVQDGTKSFQAFPPEQIQVLGSIPELGDLLLFEDQKRLLVFNYQGVFAYDTTQPATPSASWKIEYESDHQLVSARQYQDQLFLVTRTYVNDSIPCPISPMRVQGTAITIPCTDIFRPSVPTQTDSIYTISRIDPNNGAIQSSVTAVGSTGQTIVSMFPDSLYLTYVTQPDMLQLFTRFIADNPQIFPAEVQAQITQLNNYDISSQAKYVELEQILQTYHASLGKDARRKAETDIENQFSQYLTQRQRELEQTGIVKISIPDLQIVATTQVPGIPLNQFSLDEYQDTLRIATTISGRGTFGWGNLESVSDVYVLDSNLQQLGSVQDLGKTERIYAVRFIADKGYVVTFRETDPFYVLDLSSPTNPRMTGELKIPGYSSYLHPLTQDLILGVGMEESQVKLSLFNVANPTSPTEIAKYTLNEYYSDILDTHHAFLHDPQNQTFFIPGSQSAYIFNYTPTGELTLTKAVADLSARRALYLDNYLYIISDQSLVVLDQTSWQEINRIDFTSQ